MGTQGPPPSYAPDEVERKFRHRLFASSIECEIWHFLVLVVQ